MPPAPPSAFLSSGDLIADRRYRWAIDQFARGDLAGAADVLTQTLELTPRFVAAWFALGLIRDRAGDRRGAIVAFEKARDADSEDRLGAGLQLARLGADDATPEMMQAYVRRLFDQEAVQFEEALLDRLAYRGPELLLDAIKASLGEPLHIAAMLDLGCGTGLAGAAFRPHVDRLVGIDLSAAMIAEARKKHLYDRLDVAEMAQFLAREAASAAYDLVVAADALVYIADLAPVAAAVAPVLAPGGLFAFTVETHGDDGVVLQPTLRYAHGEAHVRSSLAAAGLDLRVLEPVSTRTENGSPVPGLLVIAARH